MTSISNLFGSVDSDKLESSVSKLFSSSSGPVDTLKIKSKNRTVLPEIKRTEPKEKQESGEEQEQPSKRQLDQEESESRVEEQQKPTKKKKNKKSADDNDDLESNYFSKLLEEGEKEQVVEAEKEGNKESQENLSDSSDEEEEKGEEVAKSKSLGGATATKVDMKEQELEKAERTIFIGNVPADVITSKKIYKEFKKLFSTNPQSKKNEDGEDDDEENADGDDKGAKDVFKIESIRFRSISFEEALPRKVAFVQHKLHKSRDSVNAYIVYKDKSALKPLLQHLNGFVFHDHHLRIDSVAHPAPHDNKRSVFIGNLDFEELEENLWKNFSPCGEVEYIRIIRDSKTNMGKGFAYVQFKDFQSVNKALLLNEKKINGNGRKLRVSRCKNMRKSQPAQNSSRYLNDAQRTKLGRAKKILGKADRATAGGKLTIEGVRATKGDTTPGLKGKKNRSKSGRVTKRSIAFKNSMKEMAKKG